MATRAQLIEANKKAVKSPRIGKRGKGWKTIAKEKAREAYEKKLEQGYWDEITEVHFKEAKNPKNVAERLHVIQQHIGKPKETVEIEGGFTLKLDV